MAVFLNQKRANVCEHTYIRCLLIEKDARVRQNISIFFHVCVRVPVYHDLFNFW
jgi:hypothetical protein